MTRKTITVKSADGRAIRATVGSKTSKTVTPERIIDPDGFLTVSSPPEHGLNEEEQAAFSEWKINVQSRKTKTDYP